MQIIAVINYRIKKKKLKTKLVSSTLHTSCIYKTCLFSDTFRLANVDFFREFYNNTLNACI